MAGGMIIGSIAASLISGMLADDSEEEKYTKLEEEALQQALDRWNIGKPAFQEGVDTLRESLANPWDESRYFEGGEAPGFGDRAENMDYQRMRGRIENAATNKREQIREDSSRLGLGGALDEALNTLERERFGALSSAARDVYLKEEQEKSRQLSTAQQLEQQAIAQALGISADPSGGAIAGRMSDRAAQPSGLQMALSQIGSGMMEYGMWNKTQSEQASGQDETFDDDDFQGDMYNTGYGVQDNLEYGIWNE